MIHLKKNRLFNLALLLVGVLFVQGSAPATGAKIGSVAFIGADRPDELIGKWESVISSDEADTTRVLEFYANGRIAYNEKATSHESLKQDLIMDLGADPARIQSVADSLADLKSRFHDALVSDEQVSILEFTGTWGVQGNVIQTVIDNFSLSFNGLQGNDMFAFYETIVPLVVPAEYAFFFDFFLLSLTLLQETFDALIEAQDIFEIGRYSIENDNLVVVQDEGTVRFMRVSERITSDFDGDGTVGFSDFLLFVAQFGSSQGDAGYDVRFDLDGDGTIVFSDFLIFVGVFGTTSETTSLPPPPPPENLDKAALVALYNATNGANWKTNTNWLSNRPLNEWYGVTTDSNDRVTQLVLTSNQLSGLIPSELGNLSNLRLLHLSFNNLSGSIPSELGNLSNLKSLYLDGNGLSGSIPSELGNLSNLRGLYLDDNNLSGEIPSSLGNLSNLQVLYLDNNQLSGSIPSELGNLSNLRGLRLGINPLSGSIPSSLGNLSNLESLDLYQNQLSGSIPSELGNLSNLKSLWLGYNPLSGSIPSSLGNLSNLERLRLYNNNLSGSIPSELGNLSNLQELWLFGNNLSGSIPSELGNLSNLQVLYLSSNQLSGCVPEGLRNVPSNDFTQLGLPFCGS